MLRRLALSLPVLVLAAAACQGTPHVDSVDLSDVTYEVQPFQAELQETLGGVPWDGDNSPPDVRVSLRCGDGESALSETVESLSPQWTVGSCTATGAELIRTGVQFMVVDVDDDGEQPLTVPTTLLVSPAQLQAGEVTAPLSPHSGLRRLVFRLTPR